NYPCFGINLVVETRKTVDMDLGFVPRVHSKRFNQRHGFFRRISTTEKSWRSGLPKLVTNGVTTFIPPPDGYEVNFDKPQQQNVRLYTKQALAGGLQVDDVLITFAWVASVVMQSVQILSISLGGLGHHAWEMPIDVFEKHMLSSYIAAPIFITCNGLSKTSLLTLYLRISPQK
ncbi:hypothetical protein BN1723_001821, partial [Verticillium longisporum]